MRKTTKGFVRLVVFTLLLMLVLPAVATSGWKTSGSAVAHSRAGTFASASLNTTTKKNPTDLRIKIVSKTGDYGGKMRIDYNADCFGDDFGQRVSVSQGFTINSNKPYIIKPFSNVKPYDRCTVFVSVNNTFKNDGPANFDPYVKVQAKYAG